MCIDDTTQQIKASSSTQGGTLIANDNYWGHWEGPKGIHSILKGQGDVVSGDQVSITSKLSCIDIDTWCDDSSVTCGTDDALIDDSQGTNGLCVSGPTQCTGN